MAKKLSTGTGKGALARTPFTTLLISIGKDYRQVFISTSFSDLEKTNPIPIYLVDVKTVPRLAKAMVNE